ncbi:uncharacterized protein LOC142578255 [Dermacentor variabilis]|uniref:uncharacterized protein LOC142578255 n=1 Tax=Dermacentor variabilis TaxID=34621 RepID=UPI003F5C81B2
MAYQVPQSDDAKDKWSSYYITVESYFEGNDIVDDAKKRALLISALGSKPIDVLSGRCAPRKVNELTYVEAVTIVEEFYAPPPNEIAVSFKFFTRIQWEEESAQQFTVELRRLADKCNFGTMLNRLLRGRIVCGIRSSDVQKALLSHPKLTLQEAENIVLAAEAARQGVQLMKQTEPKEEPELHRLAGDRRQRQAGKTCSQASGSSKGYHRCGSRENGEATGAFKHAICFNCRKKGHLAAVCRSKEKRPHQSLALSRGSMENAEAELSTQLYTLKPQPTADNGIVSPVRRNFCWGGANIVMEIDTGSPVCVVSWDVYYQHRTSWPCLEKSSLKLSCYLGPLPIAGKLTLPVSYCGTTVTASLTVVRVSGPSLCGRDLIQALNIEGAAVFSVSSIKEQGLNLQAILCEYEDVFAPELGLFKVPPAYLYMKEDAVPKFKARPLPCPMRGKVSNELDRLVKSGVLSPVAHSDWATPIVPVMKKDGTVRLCGDYKLTVNASCVTEQYPLPEINDLLLHCTRVTFTAHWTFETPTTRLPWMSSQRS